MSEPIPAIQAAYLNMCEVAKWMMFATEEFEEKELTECLEHIKWSINALNAAKAKIENHMKESE